MTTSSKVLTNAGALHLAWRIAKGWKGLVFSLDFLLALIVWAATAPYWLQNRWWEQVTAVLPNILGFTLGGFAIFLGFGSDDFKKLLVGRDHLRSSPYLSVSSAFLLFVSFQLLAIFYALCAGALRIPPPDFLASYSELLKWGRRVSDGVGYFLFVYSLSLALRAALRIFRLSRWYNDFLVDEVDKERRRDQRKRLLRKR